MHDSCLVIFADRQDGQCCADDGACYGPLTNSRVNIHCSRLRLDEGFGGMCFVMICKFSCSLVRGAFVY